jgi:hypothetical protein
MLTAAFSQISVGIIAGLPVYRWDRNPNTDSPGLEPSSGGISGIQLGATIIAGNDKFRFAVEGYGGYSPHTLSQFDKEIGTNVWGGLAKISITPWYGGFVGHWGFSIGCGLERITTNFPTRKYILTDITMDSRWFSVPYGYLACSLFDGGMQTDYFVKYGMGKNNAATIETGLRLSFSRRLFGR